MRFIFVFLHFVVYVSSKCNKTVGPAGITECVRLNQYTGYQWATCLSSEYIQMESRGKHYCEQFSKFCFYQCMIEFYDLDKGNVNENCSCSGITDVVSYSNVSLPSWCYEPTGSQCGWFRECLEKKYECSRNIDHISIAFPQTLCELFERHSQTLSANARKWTESVIRCVQIEMVKLLRPWINKTCSDVNDTYFQTNKKCIFHNAENNVCSVNEFDFFRMFITLVETFRFLHIDSFYDLNNLLNLKRECYHHALFRSDITLIYIITKIKTNPKKIFDKISSTNNDFQTASGIAEILSDIFNWQRNGISWYAWMDSNTENSPSNQVISVFILLASSSIYDMNRTEGFKIVDISPSINSLVSSIEMGLTIYFQNFEINVTSLEACGDLKCQHVYLDTDKCDNNNGYCPEQSYQGISWWKTAVGERDIKECPPGYSGNSSRLCSSGGKWEDPVYINCTDKALQDSADKLKNLTDLTDHKVISEVIAGVINQVLNTTSGAGDQGNSAMKSGDLQKTTDILETIISIGNASNASIDSTQLVSVIDSVLNTKNSQSWTEVNKEGTTGEGSASIMKIVENLGSLVQKGMNRTETMTFKKNNIEIKISTLLEKKLSFPSGTKSQLSLLNQTSLTNKFYTAALYKTLSGILPTVTNSTVGSDVLSLSFNEKIDLRSNITITFEQNKQINITNPEIACGYWNFSSRSWSYEGCFLLKSDPTLATCTCNHLTNFAIIMSPGDIIISKVHSTALEIITFVGCSLSILGCLLTLLIYSCLWRYVKNEWAVILINLCIGLIIGYSIFLGATEETKNDVACNIITAILHYVFLVVFFLMLAEGISVVTSVTVVFKKKSKIKIYLTLAWILPLFIVGATMGITQLKGYRSDKYCWLNVNNYVILAFVGPAMVIILINIIAIVVVLRALYSTTAMNNERIRKKARAGIKCMATLLPVLGLSWLFGVLAFNEDTIIFQYLFGVTTSCQGVFIFVFHTVLNKKVHEGFHKTLYKHRSKAMSNPTSKPKSFGTHEQLESRGSSSDTAKLKETKINTTKLTDLRTAPESPKSSKLPTDSPRLRDVRNYFKINRSQEYYVTKT